MVPPSAEISGLIEEDEPVGARGELAEDDDGFVVDVGEEVADES